MAHKPKRVGFVLDMTPLVDLAFLLLTFFMFTAKFKSDAESEQKFEIKRPSATADTTKLPDAGTAIVKIGIDDKSGDTTMWYSISNENDREPIYGALQGISGDQLKMAQIPVADTTQLGMLVLATRRQDTKIMFAIDADKRIGYDRIERVMNTFRAQGATIFNFVTVKNSSAGA